MKIQLNQFGLEIKAIPADFILVVLFPVWFMIFRQMLGFRYVNFCCCTQYAMTHKCILQLEQQRRDMELAGEEAARRAKEEVISHFIIIVLIMFHSDCVAILSNILFSISHRG